MLNKSCPSCNYKFNFKDVFFKKNYQKIICPNCKSQLTASIKSKFIFSIITLLVFLMWFAIWESNLLTFSTNSKYVLAFILFFILFFIIEPIIHKYEPLKPAQIETRQSKRHENRKSKINN